MLKKFIEIKNIGKFTDCKASGDVELKKLNVICAENGRGKTTLCDILRSLKTGKPDYIVGRKTLGNSDSQNANLRFQNDNLIFSNGAWNNSFQEIEIYDSTFIHENVYAGDRIDHDHKKNLYKVIVGQKGVELALKVVELDGKIRESSRELSANKSSIQRIIPSGLNFDAFLSLSELFDADKVIKGKEDELIALSKADEILRKENPQSIVLPEMPVEFQRIIAKSIEEISKDAERVVQDHIEQHTNNVSKEWIASGLQYSKDDVCPFCAQSIEKSKVVSAYKSYFSQSYTQLKSEIDAIRNDIENIYSEANLLRINYVITNNSALCDYWKQYVKLSNPSVDVSSIIDSLKTLLNVTQEYISKKQQSPLEAIKLGDDFWQAQKAVEDIKQSVDAYNHSVNEINKQIAIRKNEIKSADVAIVKNDITMLKARKRRFEQDAKELCESYSKACDSKRTLEQEKNQVKSDLDTYADNIFTNYEARINKLLENFGAGFRITETKRSYLGGTASSHYQIKINNVSVELGDPSSPWAIPSFRNTLSAGDKSTLALAFFVAKLESDSKLSEKIIVLDDPFSSLDRSRRTCTKQIICKLAQKAKQVIVMSHDPHFLKIIWDSSNKTETKPLQLSRLGQNSTITEWDIERETREEYHRNHSLLSEYYNNGSGDRVNVARTIRPLLEQYFRFIFPGQFSETEWLGDFIKKIREAQSGSPLVSAQSILDELDAVNDYSKRYHHNTNPAYEKEPIDDTELQSYSKRALELVGGF